MPEIFYTQSITDFLNSHLREDDKYPISAQQAEILSALCEGKLLIHIQYPDELSIDQNIYLWRYKAWYYDQERLNRLRAHSHKERVGRHLFVANVDLVTKGIIDKYRLDEDKARAMAWKWIKENNKAAIELVAGITKLKEKEEEL